MRRALALILVLAGCTPAVPPPAAPCQRDGRPPERIEEAPESTEGQVRAGECETDWLPEGTVVDLSDAEANELIEAMARWLGGDVSAQPRIDLERGVVFAKSEDDEGRDPPYPSTSSEASMLACGLTARWLRDHVRSVFALAAQPDMGGVTCDENVCCFQGMEFVSDRAIVLRRVTEGAAPAWVLVSAHEVAEAALGEPYATSNRRYVARELTRRAGERCPGEPAGMQ